MQFHSLLLFALSAGALALPAPQLDATNNTLVKRGSASIGSFDNGQCTGKAVGHRPEISNYDCIKFAPVTDNIGINWGGFPMTGIKGLDVFKDEHCKGNAAKTINAPTWSNSKGTNTCISMAAKGGPWRSIRQHIGAAKE